MSKVKLKELVKSYESSYTLPKHPKTCPECGHKVKVFHMNILNPEQNSNNAIILCSNPIKNSCVWPLDTGRKDILGKSDVITLQKIVHEKKKLSKKTDENDNFEDQFNRSSEKNQEKYQNLIENLEESPEILQESSHDLSTNSVDPDADTESEGIQEAIDPWGNVDTEFTSTTIVQEFSKSSEIENQEKYQNIIENSEESPEILQESSHDLSTNSGDPDADTESEGIQEAIDPLGDIDTDFMSLPEMEIQEIKSFSKEKVSKEKAEENQEKEEGENSDWIIQDQGGSRHLTPDSTAKKPMPKTGPKREPLIPQDQAFQSFNLSEIRKRKRKKKSQVQSWNAKGNTDVFQKIDEWQNKEADGQTGGTSNSYTQYGVY